MTEPPAGCDEPISRRSLLKAAAGASALLAMGACGSSGSSKSSATGNTASGGAALPPTTITTCVYAKNHASSPLYWQQFAPKGVTVDVKIVTSASEVKDGLESGQIDFGLMGPYNTIIAASQGMLTSKIIGMVSRQGIGIIGRKGDVSRIADLKGKKVAVPPPGIQTLIINDLLGGQGLKLGRDVTNIPLGYADQPAALQRGDVDAYVGTEPLCTQSVVLGVGQRLGAVYDTPVGDFNTALWASSRMLAKPQLCRAAAMMQRRAAEYLSPGGVNNRQRWHQLLVTEFGYSEAVYNAVLANVGAVWQFDGRRKGQFQGAGRLLLAQGAISHEPDYEARYARQYWSL